MQLHPLHLNVKKDLFSDLFWRKNKKSFILAKPSPLNGKFKKYLSMHRKSPCPWTAPPCLRASPGAPLPWTPTESLSCGNPAWPSWVCDNMLWNITPTIAPSCGYPALPNWVCNMTCYKMIKLSTINIRFLCCNRGRVTY